MDPTRLPGDARVMSCSVPLYATGQADKPAILLVHGFSGSPHDMHYLFNRLAEAGFTVLVPRLAGHGTSAADFKTTGWKDWYRSAVDAYLNLAAEGKPVYVAGLSMGGVITSMLAAQFDIQRIVLAAPAFLFTPGSGASKLWITPLFSWIINSRKRDPGNLSHLKGDRQLLESEYKGWDWYRQGTELLRMQKKAVRILDEIRARTCIVASQSDQTVSPNVVEYLSRRLGSAETVSTLLLENSHHVVVDDVDREKVAGRIIEWFND